MVVNMAFAAAPWGARSNLAALIPSYNAASYQEEPAIMIRLLFALLLLNLSPLAHAAANDVTVPMKAVRVGAHSYFVQGQPGAASSENQGFMSNAGFVVTGDGVVVFDALASPPLAEKLLGLIRTITRQPIKRVIVSHYHADHFYGLQVFKAQGAEIWAHRAAEGATRTEEAAQRLAQRKEALFPWVDDNTHLLEADYFVDGDTDFEMGGLHFALRHVGPAHTREDLAMLVREDGVLYAGDVVFRGRIPFVGDADSRAWIAAVRDSSTGVICLRTSCNFFMIGSFLCRRVICLQFRA